MRTFKVGRQSIGKNEPVFIIAEAGINHAGLFSEAQEMVEVAKKCKVNAVTFQHIAWDEINSISMSAKDNNGWDNWRLTDQQIAKLFKQAHDYNMAVTACVADFDSLEFVVEEGADFIKVVSGDITCHPFLAKCAATGLPIFLSTGNALISEIEAALKVIEEAGGSKIVLYHTNSKYPTPPQEVDLRALKILKGYDYPIGFCDHTKGTVIPLAASALGARVIEKHFSLNPSIKRPDCEVSIDPQELQQFVFDIRTVEKALGEPVKRRYPDEGDYILARRSVTAGKDLQKGDLLQWEELAYKRPGTGIQPSEAEKLIGRVLLIDVKRGELLTEKMLKS